MEIKLATAPGREAQKEPCEPPSPRRIHIRILKPRCSGHTWGGKKGREKRKGGEENKEEKRTAQPHHQSLHSNVWSPISPIKLRCSGPTGLTCIIRGWAPPAMAAAPVPVNVHPRCAHLDLRCAVSIYLHKKGMQTCLRLGAFDCASSAEIRSTACSRMQRCTARPADTVNTLWPW